jgi:hypothetical protein
MSKRTARLRRRYVGLLTALLGAVALSGCGTAELAASKPNSSQGHGAQAQASPPAATPASQQSSAATLADLLVTYSPSSPCADVLVDTPIAQVAPACAALWSPLNVGVVPGQSLLKRAPRFPTVKAGSGVTPDEALRYAAGLWRTEAFEGFALGTRQVPVVVPLGKDYLFVRVGTMERAVNNGEVVTTPLCHFFPVTMEVVEIASDLAGFEQRSGRTLGVHARFQGPCYATATNAQGVKQELFNFSGTYDVVFVGDIHTDAPFGPILWLTGLAECSKDIAKKTCAA